jgi:tripartite-type tricarboxylate transporter receptor subunit TctC
LIPMHQGAHDHRTGPMRNIVVTRWLLAAVLALLPLAGARAQGYPTKPVTVIVPFAAGGATDVLARFLGERLRAVLGQPIIIENVTGAGGSIGVTRAVRAPADGTTIEIGTSTTNVLLGGLYPLSFDLINDLAPVLQIASEPLLIVGKKTLPANDLKELIAWLKANPDKASIGIPAVGGTGHLAGLSFLKEIGAQAQFIPYRGNGPALQDLVAGQIDLQIEPASNFYQQAKAGAIKPFALAAASRVAAAPDIPTTDEAGLKGFHASLWYGMWAPKGTPKDIIARLNAAMLEALAHDDTRKRFADLGLQTPPRDRQTPEALLAFQKSEADKWWPIMKAANIRGQ